MKITIIQENNTKTTLTNVEFIFFSQRENNTISLRTKKDEHINLERVASFKWEN